MTPSRRVSPALAVVAAILLTGSGGSCSGGRSTTPEPAPESDEVRAADLGDADLRLLVITDLDGYLEPCGCTSRPLGGIDRMSAAMRARREEGVPTLAVAAGNLFFHGAPHGADAQRAEAQERMRAEAAVDILGEDLELVAAAPGPLDFGYGTDRFVALAERARFPLLAAGVTVAPPEGAEPGEPALVATTTREAGGLTVGILGLAQLAGPDGAAPERVTLAEDLVARGREAAASLREAGADVIVALVTADRRTARQIASRVEAIDVVVHGGPDEADVDPPSELEAAAFVSAGRQGQGLVVLDLHRRGEGDWVDASVWTRETRQAHLEGQIEDLEARIRDWEREGADAADVARQRARLEALRREARALAAPPPVEGRNAFTARYEELPPDAPQDDAVSRRMNEHDRRVNDHNREAFADWTPEPAPEGQPHYVGSQACASCHGAAMRWWRDHPHGRAYATLETQHKNFNLSCVGCHVTGYLQPGGSTVSHVERLEDVGCENCHGPGSMHVEDPTGASVNVHRDTPEEVCVRCHNEEHSDRFVYDAYRSTLIVPGHGRPLGGS